MASSSDSPDRQGLEPADFRGQADAVSRKVVQISGNVAAMQRLLNQIGTPKETEDVRHKLHNLTEQTREIVKLTSHEVKELGNVAAGSSIEMRQRKVIQQKLQRDFEDVLKRYQNVSKIAADKERNLVQKARANQQRVHEEEHREEDRPLISEQQRVLQVQGLDSEVEYNESLIAEREQDIREIEKSIVEVNEIFRDLGTMVNEQQYMLDNIEANVSSVAVNMENATGELRKASDYQKMSRNRMCCLLLFLAIIAIVLTLAIAL